MSATCAICLQLIVARNDVRVFGTEVMHRSCAATDQETIGVRQRREIADLNAALAAAREDGRRQLILHQQQRLRAERAEEGQRRSEMQVATAAMDRDAAREAEAIAGRFLTQALRERDKARAELARRTREPDISPPAEDERDATTIRMSLLDME